MKKNLTPSLVATAVAAMLLAGCGSAGMQPLPTAQGAGVSQALATKTLEKGFKDLHLAVFTKMDVNGDKSVDEYEAGALIDLRDFQRADKNRNGKLTRTEFMNYAIGEGVFGFFRQDKTKFMRQAREALLKAFQRLDKNKNYLIEQDEMSNEALKKVGVNLTIDGLRMKVVLTEFDYEVFNLSDKTKDGALSQAEYEDYCMTAFIKQINPDYGQEPAPPAPEPAPEDPGAGEADGWY